MKILLVTYSAILPFAFENFLNIKNGYSAIVVNEVEPAKNFLSQLGYPPTNVFGLNELAYCLKNFDYDCVVCIASVKIDFKTLLKQIKLHSEHGKYIINFNNINQTMNFNLKVRLDYIKKNSAEFKIFGTGMSYSQESLFEKYFDSKIFNFAFPSQDLYFDYQIAKFVLSVSSEIEFALIGLAPYSFHYDLSKSNMINFRLLNYFIALKDLHNFEMPISEYRKLLNEEKFLSY